MVYFCEGRLYIYYLPYNNYKTDTAQVYGKLFFNAAVLKKREHTSYK